MNCNNVFSFSYYCCFIWNSKLHRLFNWSNNTSAILISDDYKEKQRKGAVTAKRIYNVSLGILIFATGLLVIFLNKIDNETLHEYLDFGDPLLQNLFGGLCIIYGLFRLYRGIKKDY